MIKTIESQTLGPESKSKLLVLFLSFVQGFLLLVQLSLPLQIIDMKNQFALISLGALSLALSFAGRALGIYSSGSFLKSASLISFVCYVSTYFVFESKSILGVILGSFIYGIGTSATNIFTRSKMLSLEAKERSNLFFYVLISNVAGMWCTIFSFNSIVFAVSVLALVSLLILEKRKAMKSVTDKIHPYIPNSLNWRDVSATFISNKLFMMRTALLILMSSLFNASIFPKLKLIYTTFDELLVYGLSLVTLGVFVFRVSNALGQNKDYKWTRPSVDLIYLIASVIFFLSSSPSVIIIGIPLTYFLSQVSYLNLLRDSEKNKISDFSIVYEINGFLTGILFSFLSYKLPHGLQWALIFLVSIYSIISIKYWKSRGSPGL